MATPAFPPTPASPQPPQGGPPNPIGTAVSSAPNQASGMIQQVGGAVKTIIMFSQALQSSNPQAAQKFQNAIREILPGIQILKCGQGAPAGSVPPPPQMAAESPAETPEAT